MPRGGASLVKAVLGWAPAKKKTALGYIIVYTKNGVYNLQRVCFVQLKLGFIMCFLIYFEIKQHLNMF